MKKAFRQIAQWTSNMMGAPQAFVLALLIVLVWAATGPAYHYSDTWQLVINTGTTVVTFLMVFLIQNTQNRDARVMHLKLDELIRALTTARTELVDMEALSDDELERLHHQFKKLHDHAAAHHARRMQRRAEAKQASTANPSP
jgi:low affinity Fe/Cu permease